MESKPKAHLFAFTAMALFIFVFLGSEYHFDIAYGELAGPDSVVGAQASILATSAIGLVGYSLVNRMAVAKHRSILAGVLGTISVLLLIATQLTQSASALLSLGCLLFLILGMLGNATYFFRCPNPLCQQLSFPPGGRLVCRRLVSSIPASFFGTKQHCRSRDYRSLYHRAWFRTCSSPQRAARNPR